MTLPPRLVVSDLDGTFLLPDGSVSDASRATLARAAEQGLRVIFATGRPPRWLGVLDGLPMVDPVVVASNGALLWHLGERRALRRVDVPGDAAAAVVTDVRQVVPDVAFACEQGVRFGFEEAYVSGMGIDDIDGDDRFFQAPAEQLVTEPFVKLLVQSPSLDAETLAARVSPVVGGRLTVTHSAFGGFGLLELSAPGITKAATLDTYAAGLGIAPADVAAFGDMPNDLDMLRWAGHPYVMETCHPELASLHAERIGCNSESAVAATIEEWLS